MAELQLVVRNGTAFCHGRAQRADVAVEDGRIVALGDRLRGKREVDATGCWVMPGIVDAHTHMALPVCGLRSGDDFDSGTRAAAFGGVTCIVDFSVAEPGMSLAASIESRREQAAVSVVDYSLHSEVVGMTPSRLDEFADACRLGVRSFKFYTTYSDSGRMTDDGMLFRCFRRLALLGGRAVVHAENDAIVLSMTKELLSKGRTSITDLPDARPSVCEAEAVSRVCLLARHAGVELRIAHLTSGDGLAEIAAARRRSNAGAPSRVWVETCPQYLLLDETSYEQACGRCFAATPPLRTSEDRLALWNGIAEGMIDLVATDHCPFTRAEKTMSERFVDLPYGIPGVETLLPLLLGEVLGSGRIGSERLVELLCEGPARALGLWPRKGVLAVGADADIVIVDPRERRSIRTDDLHMATDFSPYEGHEVVGWPRVTIVRGKIVVEEGRFVGETGWGRFVPQQPTAGSRELERAI
ncbi:dihydropyrimidinase [Candidatus Bipolaricaulota bacterium]|nr:dihydropyrimidinase [Candidatus Bipolaricaulota bacterium]